MKKLKIMMLSVALVAVVGGALAFKARYQSNYCTTVTTGTCPTSGLACPNISLKVTTTNTGDHYCTADLTGTDCNSVNCGSAASVQLKGN